MHVIRTVSQVSIMKQEIIDLQPELIKSSKETEELQILVEADAEKANAKRVNFSISKVDSENGDDTPPTPTLFQFLSFFSIIFSYRTSKVAKPQELVAKDEAVANEAAAVAGAIKADCEADLAEALPALEAAISALDTLKPSDISQVRESLS
jgi:dynein heavy chain